eukprot:s1043_g6.t1
MTSAGGNASDSDVELELVLDHEIASDPEVVVATTTTTTTTTVEREPAVILSSADVDPKPDLIVVSCTGPTLDWASDGAHSADDEVTVEDRTGQTLDGGSDGAHSADDEAAVEDRLRAESDCEIAVESNSDFDTAAVERTEDPGATRSRSDGGEGGQDGTVASAVGGDGDAAAGPPPTEPISGSDESDSTTSSRSRSPSSRHVAEPGYCRACWKYGRCWLCRRDLRGHR